MRRGAGAMSGGSRSGKLIRNVSQVDAGSFEAAPEGGFQPREPTGSPRHRDPQSGGDLLIAHSTKPELNQKAILCLDPVCLDPPVQSRAKHIDQLKPLETLGWGVGEVLKGLDDRFGSPF